MNRVSEIAQQSISKPSIDSIMYLVFGVFISGCAMYALSMLIHKCNEYFYKTYGVEDSTELISLSDINSRNFIGDAALIRVERWDKIEKRSMKIKRDTDEVSKKLSESMASVPLKKHHSRYTPIHAPTEPSHSPK